MKVQHLFFVLVLVGWSAIVSGQSPEGSEFQVNTYSTGVQWFPNVAVAADGSFVVVYGSDGGDGQFGTVFGQRYDAAGIKRGAEFVVNTYTTSSQSGPSVDCEADGDFVVVWQSTGSDGADTDATSIQGQRFASDGSSRGVQFEINTYTTSSQTGPWVDLCGNGDFVVVWSSDTQDTDGQGVFGQRYNSNGTANGGEFAINTYTSGDELKPQVGCDADGDFVVVWQDNNFNWGSNARNTIFARTYGSNGSAHQSPEFRVSGATTVHWESPSVDSADDGGFVVAWTSPGNYEVFSRRYSVSGTAQGAEFQVADADGASSVAMDNDGDFIIAWSEYCGSAACKDDILIRGYNSDGSDLFTEWGVNTYTTENQQSASINLAGGGIGRFVVVWYSEYSDTIDTEHAIKGQRFTSTIPVELQKFITE